MPIRSSVVDELRTMFKKGATLSKLIKHVRLRHPDEKTWWHALVQDYFREAFAVSLVRISNAPEDFDKPEMRYAHLNRHLVRAIIQSRAKWDVDADTEESSAGSWCSSLTATSDEELIKEAHPENVPELAEGWSDLGSRGKQYLQELMGNVNALYERVVILSQLAECLQMQLETAERQLVENKLSDERAR